MSKSEEFPKSYDRLLGMNCRITRRDFLNTSLLGAGATLLQASPPIGLIAKENSWDGYGAIGDYAVSSGNPPK